MLTNVFRLGMGKKYVGSTGSSLTCQTNAPGLRALVSNKQSAVLELKAVAQLVSVVLECEGDVEVPCGSGQLKTRRTLT